MSDLILALQTWYLRQCNGDWEHEFGIKIENIDNPGWRVLIPLERTDCENKIFEDVEIERSKTDWLHCKKKGSQFLAWGGPSNLNEILKLFLLWSCEID